MDTQKIVVVLLIIAILFSVATIWKVASADTGGDLVSVDSCSEYVDCVGSGGEKSGNIGVAIVSTPTEESE